MTDKPFELSIHRVIDTPRSAVWNAWTVPEYLVTWWCHRPRTTQIRAFDLRTGGMEDGHGSIKYEVLRINITS